MIQVRSSKGQALAEMVVAIPLLLLLAAGMVQFTFLFLSYVQFEHACGEAGRSYAAGFIAKGELKPRIAEGLGNYRRFFDLNTMQVTTEVPSSKTAAVFEKTRNALAAISVVQWGFNYDGAKWKVSVRFKPPLFFKPIFPDGVPFTTTLQVYRYPA